MAAGQKGGHATRMRELIHKNLRVYGDMLHCTSDPATPASAAENLSALWTSVRQQIAVLLACVPSLNGRICLQVMQATRAGIGHHKYRCLLTVMYR